MRIFVIGGINMYICGIPGVQLRPHDSNPGRITMVPGGVGRNIAENLVRLDAEVELVTVFGTDNFAEQLEQSCRDLGIGIEYAVHTEGRSCVNVSIRETDGISVAGVTDMNIMEDIDCCHLEKIIPEINQADACIIDANLSIDAIEYIVENVTVPIFADPVSVTKSVKLKSVLDKILCIRPSKAEASALTGIDMDDDRSMWVAAEMLIEQGVKMVFITLGPHGIIFADNSELGQLPARRVIVENRSGAGDSVTAAICYAYLSGKNISDCADFGNLAGCVTVQTEELVSEEIAIIKEPDADIHEIDEIDEFLRE